MKSPTNWLSGRTADFTPEEMASALAWIADVQRDAIEACAADVEDTATYWDPDDQPALEEAAQCIRALLPEGGA